MKKVEMTRQNTQLEAEPDADTVVDLFVIGGGVNGCGIAREAAGRGLTVMLAEMDDLAHATSSSSTKLFHGGLRYLEYFEFGLVRKALKEREVLLRAMPHISWPMRFVLPYHKDMRFEGGTPTSRLLGLFFPWMRGRRPAWLIRLGLFLYDHLGGREILPGTTRVDLRVDPVGAPIVDQFQRAYEYSDCWVDDARLVVLNASDARDRGATILTRHKVTQASRENGLWHITLEDQRTGAVRQHRARALVNAAGPWVGDVIHDIVEGDNRDTVRLVRGSHIVTKKLFDHDKCYFFQGTDGRIIFAIPYETDFTLIGTTDLDHADPGVKPECTSTEQDYLRTFASTYFKRPITQDDIVWTYSGVRPLYDDGASSATAATREYVLKLDDKGGVPLVNVFGGKITTFRHLSEQTLEKLVSYFPGMGETWTEGVPLPGGDFPVDGVEPLIAGLLEKYTFLDDRWTRRLVRAYGTDAENVIGDAKKVEDLGHSFGAGLTEREVNWLRDREFAQTAEDIVWRRSKLGLRLNKNQIAELEKWMSEVEPAAA